MPLKVFRMDASGCNGCDIEILSALLDQRLGSDIVEVVDDPSVAQAILVTGGINEKTLDELKSALAKLQEPRLVVAIGTCASSMCVFKGSYPMKGPLDAVTPVSVAILGCPPRPQTLVNALRSALDAGWKVPSSDARGPEGLRGMIAHDAAKCTACGACARSCPSGAIDLVFEGEKAKIAYNLWKCSFCGTCQDVCPDDAVQLTASAPMWGADKADAAISGEMARAKCKSCGAQMHAERQSEAIKKRVANRAKVSVEAIARLDESLSICPACKSGIFRVSATRKGMERWAYD
jgi:Ni,Fe-hydrogenase III small subunit/Pyruvate/2-oxoacid:ferredoxin oxidoreductase delta subunit